MWQQCTAICAMSSYGWKAAPSLSVLVDAYSVQTACSRTPSRDVHPIHSACSWRLVQHFPQDKSKPELWLIFSCPVFLGLETRWSCLGGHRTGTSLQVIYQGLVRSERSPFSPVGFETCSYRGFLIDNSEDRMLKLWAVLEKRGVFKSWPIFQVKFSICHTEERDSLEQSLIIRNSVGLIRVLINKRVIFWRNSVNASLVEWRWVSGFINTLHKVIWPPNFEWWRSGKKNKKDIRSDEGRTPEPSALESLYIVKLPYQRCW